MENRCGYIVEFDPATGVGKVFDCKQLVLTRKRFLKSNCDAPLQQKLTSVISRSDGLCQSSDSSLIFVMFEPFFSDAIKLTLKPGNCGA